MKQSISQLKNWFKKGLFPTESQFADWMDSYFHKDETISISSIDGLADKINLKADNSVVTELSNKVTNLGTDIDTLNNAATFYVNKYEPGGNVTFVYNPSTIRGASIIIPMLDDFGQLKDCTEGYKNKVGFWISDAVVDTNGVTITDWTVFQYAAVCLQYKMNGEINLCPCKLRFSQTAQVKDLFGKQIEVMFDAYMTWAAPVINGTADDALYTSPITLETTVMLNTTTPTYQISSSTAEVVGITAQTTGCSVITASLDADQSVTFVISEDSKSMTINGTSYLAGDTVFCVYDYENDKWNINNTLAPVIVDYSDLTVQHVISDSDKIVTLNTSTARGVKILYSKGTIGDKVAVLDYLYYSNVKGTNASAYEAKQGLYYIADKDSQGYCWLKLSTEAKNLRIIRDSNGNVWENGYDGVNASSIHFKKIDAYADIIVDLIFKASNALTSLETGAGRGCKIYYPSSVIHNTVCVLDEIPAENTDTSACKVGLHRITDKDSNGYCWLTQITEGTNLKIVRCGTNGGMWQNQYDGKNASSLKFINLATKADLVNGLVPSTQLPSYVDDIVEISTYTSLPAAGETSKIYVTLDTNKCYRWSGSIYIEVAGETQASILSKIGYTPEDTANKSTDGTLADNSDILFPTQKAVKTYVGVHAKSAICQSNPATVTVLGGATAINLTRTASYTRQWTTANNVAPKSGVLKVDGFIEWVANSGTNNPLIINLLINGVSKMITKSLLSSTGKAAHVGICSTLEVAAGDTIEISAYIGGSSGTISSNSEFRYEID